MPWEKVSLECGVLKNKEKLLLRIRAFSKGIKRGVHGHGLAHRLFFFSPFLYHHYSKKTPSDVWVFPWVLRNGLITNTRREQPLSFKTQNRLCVTGSRPHLFFFSVFLAITKPSTYLLACEE